MSRSETPDTGNLAGIRVIEITDESAEYCGLTLAGLGADVIKVEPPSGCATRRIGPFYGDTEDPERSLHFWHYNRGKRSVILDLKSPAGQESLRSLLGDADVLLQSVSVDHPDDLQMPLEVIRARFPRLVIARMSPFGEHGPWARYKASDLIHLALGGVMMNCGYDPNPAGFYELPPVAPQLWQAYHIAGDQLAVGIVSALVYRQSSGHGQVVSCAIHEAVAKNTELDVMAWVMRRVPLYRQTCRHAMETRNDVPTIASTKDGRWMMTFVYGGKDEELTRAFLRSHGLQVENAPENTEAAKARSIPGSGTTSHAVMRLTELNQRLIADHTYESAPWMQAQSAGLLWAPLRKPHENIIDEHWKVRGTFTDIDHPELGRSFCYPTSKWISTLAPWQPGRRAPLLNEDAELLLTTTNQPSDSASASPPTPKQAPRLSRHGKPFALGNVRVLDFGWYLATAGGSRYLAALGAECLKVEWRTHPDSRLGNMAPIGGREARNKATGPLPGSDDPDMGGQFNNKNAGKRGISLNVMHPKGLAIAKRLIAISDVVTDGFSPGVMKKWGLSYEDMRAVRSDIIYVQQSGMGTHGTYGRFRTIGPVAAAMSGISEMSGLPEPAMPAGWGYSYLDWLGAYTFAQAIVAALYRRGQTGEGQWIDGSQCEVGIFANGPAILDWSANGRSWQRVGNRSPYKPAAPHGAYRCLGNDRWLAIACFNDAEWSMLARVAGHLEWLSDARFASLAARLRHQDALDALVGLWTATMEPYAAMELLQQAGVPAGVCQTAEDRCDRDPQLQALHWLTEVTGKKIGTWPVVEVPMQLDKTPPHAGGPIDRGAPCYGEDNEYVMGELLGMTTREIKALADENVI